MRLALFLALCASPALGAIATEEVDYKDGNLVLQGYFAYDDSIKGKRPAVMVVHHWMGHGDYARRRARELAALGYLAFANDMYGKGVLAKDHAEAGKLAGAVRGDRALMRRRARAGIEAMKKHKLADGKKLSAIGYCFGGTTVLELARGNAPLKGVVSFHGALDTPSPAKSVTPKVLVLHGGDDLKVGEAIPAFEAEMRAAKADWQLVSYGGAVHGFTERENAKAYHESADRRSWGAMKAFFDEIFR